MKRDEVQSCPKIHSYRCVREIAEVNYVVKTEAPTGENQRCCDDDQRQYYKPRYKYQYQYQYQCKHPHRHQQQHQPRREKNDDDDDEDDSNNSTN